jgi:hypothetical protein
MGVSMGKLVKCKVFTCCIGSVRPLTATWGQATRSLFLKLPGFQEQDRMAFVSRAFHCIVVSQTNKRARLWLMDLSMGSRTISEQCSASMHFSDRNGRWKCECTANTTTIPASAAGFRPWSFVRAHLLEEIAFERGRRLSWP